MRPFVDFFNLSRWSQISTYDLLQLFNNYHRHTEQFYRYRIGTRVISELFKFNIIFGGSFFAIEILSPVLQWVPYKELTSITGPVWGEKPTLLGPL
jgi:hypothetical protein